MIMVYFCATSSKIRVTIQHALHRGYYGNFSCSPQQDMTRLNKPTIRQAVFIMDPHEKMSVMSLFFGCFLIRVLVLKGESHQASLDISTYHRITVTEFKYPIRNKFPSQLGYGIPIISPVVPIRVFIFNC